MNFTECYKGDSIQTPVVFMKPASSINLEGIVELEDRDILNTWVEAEIGIKVCIKDGNFYIDSICLANDITRHNIHSRDHHLAFSKGRKQFLPISPKFIKYDKDRHLKIDIKTFKNGLEIQSYCSSEMMLDFYGIIDLVSQTVPLMDGDLILCGTAPNHPNGHIMECGIVNKGDHIEIRSETLDLQLKTEFK